MVTVKLQHKCLLEMNKAAYDSEILFQHMIGAVCRHHINYTFFHDKDFPHKQRRKVIQTINQKKSSYSEKEIMVSNERKKSRLLGNFILPWMKVLVSYNNFSASKYILSALLLT